MNTITKIQEKGYCQSDHRQMHQTILYPSLFFNSLENARLYIAIKLLSYKECGADLCIYSEGKYADCTISLKKVSLHDDE